MSRLLLLLPSVPAPLDSGARIRNRGLLKLLGLDHQVDALAFGSAADGALLAQMARRTAVAPPPRRRSVVSRAIDMARTDLPDMAQRLWSAEFMRLTRCFVDDDGYDAIQAEGIEMAAYLGAVGPERRIYDAHNAEFLLQRRLLSLGSPLARVYSRLQWRRLERFERDVVSESRFTLAVSDHDANQLAALVGGRADVRVVQNGIDLANYSFIAPRAGTEDNLLFLGKLDFRPNTAAVAWFVGEVLRHLPQARLFAVGANPPAWLVKAGQLDDRIAVTGYVPDERPYLERCGVLILPLRTGAGSRLKALIAMASGLPIVATHVGMEGLEAEPDVHYLAAESTSEWIASIRRLLAEDALRQRLARAARSLVEERYDWSVIRGAVRTAYACIEGR